MTQPELTRVPRTQSWFTVADGGALGEAVAVGVGAAGWGDALTPAPLGDGVLDALAPHKVPVQSHVAQEPVLGPPRVPEEHTEVSKHHPQAVNVVHAEQLVQTAEVLPGGGGRDGCVSRSEHATDVEQEEQRGRLVTACVVEGRWQQ